MPKMQSEPPRYEECEPALFGISKIVAIGSFNNNNRRDAEQAENYALINSCNFLTFQHDVLRMSGLLTRLIFMKSLWLGVLAQWKNYNFFVKKCKL